jgi:hypothetical protein
VSRREDATSSLQNIVSVTVESKTAATNIDHPVGNLAHAETRRMAELLLLLLTWVRMVGVTMQPGLEVICSLLGEFTSLTLRTVD